MKKRLLIFLTAFTLLMSVLVVPINAADDSSVTVDKYRNYVYNDYMSLEFNDDFITVYNLTFDSDEGCFFDLGSASLFEFIESSESLIVLLWSNEPEYDVLLRVGYFEELYFDENNSCSFIQLENTNDKVYGLYNFFESYSSSYSSYNFTFLRDEAINVFDLLQPFYCGDIESTITGTEAKISILYDSSITYLYIPETLYGKPVTTLESWAFSYLPYLPCVYLPDSLKFINSSCFAYCSKLQNVSIGNNVVFVGSSCFLGTSFENSVISRDGSKTYFLKCELDSGFCFSVPDGVTLLAGGSLRNTSFDYISFPKELEHIGPKVFYQNKNTTLYDFSYCKQIPSVLSDSFDTTLLNSANAKIIVPGSLYDEWISYSNWSLFSSYISPLNYLDVFEQGYNDGITEGTETGYQNGYTQGKTDGVAEGTENGYQNGYTQGKTDGVAEGTENGYQIGFNEGTEAWYNNGYQGGYNDGIIKGQKDSDIVEKGLNGFFSGLSAFFSPFFSLGFGGITVASILGLAITVFVIILIFKLTRG